MNISFKFSRLLPKTDEAQVEYDVFRERFNQVGNTVVLAIDSFDVFDPELYPQWQRLQDDLNSIDGVAGVLSPINALNLLRNDSLEQLYYESLNAGFRSGNLDSMEMRL